MLVEKKQNKKRFTKRLSAIHHRRHYASWGCGDVATRRSCETEFETNLNFFFFQIPTGIFKFRHHHNHIDASCVSTTTITATVPHRYVNTYFHHCCPFFGHCHTFKFQVLPWRPPNDFFSLFFGFCSTHFLFKLEFIFSFLFQFSTLFSGLPYDMVFFFFFSLFHLLAQIWAHFLLV